MYYHRFLAHSLPFYICLLVHVKVHFSNLISFIKFNPRAICLIRILSAHARVRSYTVHRLYPRLNGTVYTLFSTHRTLGFIVCNLTHGSGIRGLKNCYIFPHLRFCVYLFTMAGFFKNFPGMYYHRFLASSLPL
jgi:hypothetical protein